MDTNDDKDKNDQLSNTNDDAEQIKTYLFSYISAVSIVATKAPVFPSDKVPASLS